MIPNSVWKRLKLIRLKHDFNAWVSDEDYQFYWAWTGEDLRESNSSPDQIGR